MNPTFCYAFVNEGCNFGFRCKYRHDIYQCNCGLILPLKHTRSHLRGRRHQILLQQNPQNALPVEPQTHCSTCGKDVPVSNYTAHTEAHRIQRLKEIDEALDEAERDKEGIVVSSSEGIDFDIVEVEGPTIEISITVENTVSSSSIALQNCRMRSSTRKDQHGKHFSAQLKGKARQVRPGNPRKISVFFHSSYAGRYEDTLELVFFSIEKKTRFIITRRVSAIVGSKEDHEELRSRVPYSRRAAPTFSSNSVVIQSLRPPIWTKTKWVERLPEFKPPQRLIDAVFNARTNNPTTLEKAARALMPSTFNEHTYGAQFQVPLYIEEEQMRLDLDRYSLEGETLEADYPRYKLKVAGLAENRPSVLVGDFILVGRPEEMDSSGRQIWYEGRVHHVYQDHVALRFKDSFSVYRGTTFNVRFILNRLSYRRMHHALINSFNPPRILFPAPSHLKHRRVTRAQIDDLVLFNRQLQDDEEQLETVASIVNQPSGSVPFIVFGPPGTGKTVTIVEAIRQLLQNPDVRVLACTPNNSAADILAQKLMDLGVSLLFRLNSLTRKIKDLPKTLTPFSLINNNEVFAIPTVTELRKYRVIVSTCVSGGVPASLGVKRGHFSHIFIDEAGQAKEPELMVPIKSIADEKTNIILAGDNKQMGPVIHSQIARALGLKTSYLSRLMDRDIYSLQATDQGSRGITIVKLIKNFRSHPAILDFPNTQFYKSELVPSGDRMLTHSLENYEELPRKKFPIIFHGVVGRDEQEKFSPSFFNVDEVTLVKKYCMSLVGNRKSKLKAEHIGIITPYHAQKCKIVNALQKDTKLRDITVGSVEEFQGQERRVIILSTVRSNMDFLKHDIKRSLGFVANQRRFNVAITRAQALLIVVGNPVVLSLDPLWRSFLNYVYTKGGWRGKPIDWDPEAPVDMESYQPERRTKGERELEETIQQLNALIVQEHVDSDFENDIIDGEDDDDAAAFERPIFRESE